MKTVSKFKMLAGMDQATALKALAAAVGFEFSLPVAALDMMGPQAAFLGKGVRAMDAASRRVSVPTLDQIKAYLAQKYTTTADTPQLADTAGRVESWFHTNMPELDLGWMSLFQMVDLRGTPHDSFEINGTNAGITFKQRAPGEKVEIRREITEESLPVKYLTFSDGVGILDDWMTFQKWWTIEQVVAEFRAKAWDKKAELHYGLFTALGAGINQAFDADDTKTFNAAAASILRGVRAKGYGAGQNTQFDILCAPEHLGRVNLMLEAQQGSARVAFQAGAQPISYSVRNVVSTTFVPSNSSGYYLVLPGRKIQSGNWKDLSVEQNRDIYTRAQDIVGTEQFNAAIGDSAQVKRVLFS